MTNQIKRYYCIAQGRVQGVGFRGRCMMLARELGLTGSVKNLDNGMVEIYIQGNPIQLQTFLDRLQQPDTWIRIDNLSSKSVDIIPQEKEFTYHW